MDAFTDREIMKASDSIDKAFAAMTKENGGEKPPKSVRTN